MSDILNNLNDFGLMPFDYHTDSRGMGAAVAMAGMPGSSSGAVGGDLHWERWDVRSFCRDRPPGPPPPPEDTTRLVAPCQRKTSRLQPLLDFQLQYDPGSGHNGSRLHVTQSQDGPWT